MGTSGVRAPPGRCCGVGGLDGKERTGLAQHAGSPDPLPRAAYGHELRNRHPTSACSVGAIRATERRNVGGKERQDEMSTLRSDSILDENLYFMWGRHEERRQFHIAGTVLQQRTNIRVSRRDSTCWRGPIDLQDIWLEPYFGPECWCWHWRCHFRKHHQELCVAKKCEPERICRCPTVPSRQIPSYRCLRTRKSRSAVAISAPTATATSCTDYAHDIIFL